MSWVVCAGVCVIKPSFCMFMERSQLSRYGSQEARNPEEQKKISNKINENDQGSRKHTD